MRSTCRRSQAQPAARHRSSWREQDPTPGTPGDGNLICHFDDNRAVSEALAGANPQIDISYITDMTSPLPQARKAAFRRDVSRGLTRLLDWCRDRCWLPACPDAFEIRVSSDFKISKSLVPAWFGQSGYMEFPAWRVNAGEAAIVHELVHVCLPNANRLLAEGLAIALQAAIGENPAFPNFGRPLHDLARERLAEMIPAIRPEDAAGVTCIRFDELDRIATPGPLVLAVGDHFFGEDPVGQSHLYPIAGSFVTFLLETYGAEPFGVLYARTPLVPFQQNAGSESRWAEIYGVSITELSREWCAMIDETPVLKTRPRALVASNNRQKFPDNRQLKRSGSAARMETKPSKESRNG